MGRANVTDATTREERREKRKREEAGILSLSSFLLPSLAAPFFLVAVIPRVSRTSLPGSACEVGRARDREGRSSSLEKGKREDESKAYSMSERAKEREGERERRSVSRFRVVSPSFVFSFFSCCCCCCGFRLLACLLTAASSCVVPALVSFPLSLWVHRRTRERAGGVFWFSRVREKVNERRPTFSFQSSSPSRFILSLSLSRSPARLSPSRGPRRFPASATAAASTG